MRILQPEGWARPKGYSHGIAADGTMVFVAGQIGCVADGTIQTDDFISQTRQALENTVAVLAEANATPAHITRMTWYVTDKRDYLDNLAEVGSAFRDTIGRHFPATALVQVSALVEDRAKVEIETTAVMPNPAS